MDSPVRFEFPQGKRFAFTIVDDTDVATVANVKPLYDLLHELGFRTTKTVWPLGCPEGKEAQTSHPHKHSRTRIIEHSRLISSGGGSK